MADYRYQSRREFLKALALAAAAAGTGSLAGRTEVLLNRGTEKLTILYTNDQHSRIEPFPDDDPKYAGEGGFAKRAALIEKIRKEEENVLLLDAGDIFQGTPYFNYFSGEAEYRLMSMMRYDAVTFGNHDFDLGCENIRKQMPHASFDFLNCNYDFSETALSGSKKILPYKVFRKKNLKVGVFGVGIELENLVDKKLVKGIKYLDPVECSNNISSVLKYDEKCDYIVCLSHLGFRYDDMKISDVALASQIKNIDLIIGGHTHTFLEEPVVIKNAQGSETRVTQVGWGGIWLGRADIFFSAHNKKIFQSNSAHKI